MYGFTPTIKEISVNDKVIRYLKDKKQFEIVSNKKYYSDWALMLLIAALLLAGAITVPLFLWNQIAGYISLIIPVLFILAGIRFYYLAQNDDRKIYIDPSKKIMLYHTSLAIPFQSIKNFTVTKTDVLMIKNKFRIKKTTGFQIDAEDHKGNKAPLVKSENEEKIKLILKEISLLSGVPQKWNAK
jgi:CTP:phosphocholine cytidylyltransferase-like protein